MRPVAMTTAVRRGERQDQEKRVAESGAGPSARVHDPHANPQLVQALPRRPVREAPIRPAGQGCCPSRAATGTSRWAARGPLCTQRSGDCCHGLWTRVHSWFDPLLRLRGAKAASRLTKAITRGSLQKVPIKMLVAAAAYGGFKAIESVASWYIRAQTPGQRGLRARGIGSHRSVSGCGGRDGDHAG